MGKKFDKLNGKLPEFKGGKTKQTKVEPKAQYPSKKMLEEGAKSAKKAKAAGKDLPGGGYKKGGKVSVKGKKK